MGKCNLEAMHDLLSLALLLRTRFARSSARVNSEQRHSMQRKQS
jgi:hypothetical protein